MGFTPWLGKKPPSRFENLINRRTEAMRSRLGTVVGAYPTYRWPFMSGMHLWDDWDDANQETFDKEPNQGGGILEQHLGEVSAHIGITPGFPAILAGDHPNISNSGWSAFIDLDVVSVNGSFPCLFSLRSQNSVPLNSLWCGQNNGGNDLQLVWYDGSPFQDVQFTNGWLGTGRHRYLLTRDGSTFSLYADGELIDTDTNANSIVPSTATHSWNIGRLNSLSTDNSIEGYVFSHWVNIAHPVGPDEAFKLTKWPNLIYNPAFTLNDAYFTADILPKLATATLSADAAEIQLQMNLAANAGAATLTTLAPGVDYNLQPDPASLGLSPLAATISLEVPEIDLGAMTLTTLQAGVHQGEISVDLAALTAATQAATVNLNWSRIVASPRVEFQTFAATLGLSLSPDSVTLGISPLSADVELVPIEIPPQVDLHRDLVGTWPLTLATPAAEAPDLHQLNRIELVDGTTYSRIGGTAALKLSDGGAGFAAPVLEPAGRSMSWSLWVYTNGPNGYLVNAGGVGGPDACWILYLGSAVGNAWTFTLGVSEDGASHDAAGDTTNLIELNTWAHRVVTYDQANGEVNHYHNGQLSQTITGFDTAITSTLQNITVGEYNNVFDPGEFLGIRGLRVWNRVLASNEVLAVYEGQDKGDAPIPEKVVGYRRTNAKVLSDVYNRGLADIKEYDFGS